LDPFARDGGSAQDVFTPEPNIPASVPITLNPHGTGIDDRSVLLSDN
jgi:hypothetical protein